MCADFCPPNFYRVSIDREPENGTQGNVERLWASIHNHDKVM